MKFIKKEQLKELIDIVFEIQSKSKTQIFINYFPHVDQVNIEVYKDGWTAIKNPTNYLNWGEYKDNDLYSFERIKKILKKYRK